MNFPTILRRSLLTLVGIALTLVVAYAGWRVVKAYWAPLMLFTFVISGIAFTVFSAAAVNRARWSPSLDAIWLAAAETRARTGLARLQLAAEYPLIFLEMLTGTWLYLVIHSVWPMLSRRRSQRAESLIQAGTRVVLEGVQAGIAPTVFFLVLVAYGIAYVAPAEMYWIRAFLILMAINTMLRHVHYAVGFTSLPVQLRRTSVNPYIAFVIVAVTDLLSLTLTLNGILNWNAGEVASWTGIWNILRGLFVDAWHIAKGVWNGRELPLRDMLPALAGVLYNGGTLLKTLLSLKDFRRDDSDYTQIAQSYCVIGRFTDALSALKKIKYPNSGTFYLSTAAHLGVSQFDSALEECKRFLSLQQKGDPTARQVLYTLVGVSANFPLAPDTYVELLRRCIKAGSDSLAMTAISALAPEVVSPLFSDPSVAERFPLSYASVLLAEKKSEEARSWLDQVKPGGASERIFRSFLVLFATLANPDTTTQQDVANFEKWSREHFDEISHWVSNPSEGSDRVDRFLVYGYILRVQIIATHAQSHSAQSWLFVLEKLKEVLATEAFGGSFSLLARLEEVTRRQFRA
jgi:hypothetical protein